MKLSRHCNPNLCSVLIMDDVSRISNVIKLTAALSGLWVMSKVFFVGHGHKGELLKYKEFCKMHKSLFMSQRWRWQNLELVKVIEDATDLGGSNTKVIPPDRQEWAIGQATKLCQQGKGTNYMFLLTQTEKATFKGLRDLVNTKRFLSSGLCA